MKKKTMSTPTKASKRFIHVDRETLRDEYADVLDMFPHAEFVRDATGVMLGVLRFKRNGLARWLLDSGRTDLVAISIAQQNGEFPIEDRMQFYIDLGYSVEGFMECFHKEVAKRARAKRARTAREAQAKAKAARPTAAFIYPDGEVLHMPWRDGPISNVTLSDIIALVDEAPPSAKEISKWTAAMKAEALAWASACHLNASDNDDVKVPKRPEFL